MNLKELLGENYKEDLTLKDVDALLEGKKLVDLTTGKYVDKDKYAKIENDFNKYKEETKDYSDLKTKTTEYQGLQEKYDALNKQNEKRNYIDKLVDLKVDKDFAEFILTKVEIGEKFEENAKAFLEKNPKFLIADKKKIDTNPNYKLGKDDEPGDLASALKEKYAKGE